MRGDGRFSHTWSRIHSRHTTPGNNSQALYWRIANGLFPGVKHTNTSKYINDIHVTQKSIT